MEKQQKKYFKIIGSRAQKLRKDMHLTLDDVAKKIGISAPTLQLIEQNKKENGSPADVILKIADFYDVSIDYLVGRCSNTTYQNITDYYQDAAEVRSRIAYEKYLQAKKTDVLAPWPYNLFETVLHHDLYGAHIGTILADDQILALKKALDDIPSREKQILIMSFKNRQSLIEISKSLDIGVDKVRQIREGAIMRLERYDQYMIYGYNKYTQMMAAQEKARKENNLKKYNIENDDVLNIQVTNLGLSHRACNCLLRAEIYTVKDILECSIVEGRLQVWNLGVKGTKEILKKLFHLGIKRKF